MLLWRTDAWPKEYFARVYFSSHSFLIIFYKSVSLRWIWGKDKTGPTIDKHCLWRPLRDSGIKNIWDFWGLAINFQKEMNLLKKIVLGSPLPPPLVVLTHSEILEWLRTSWSEKVVQRKTYSDAKTLCEKMFLNTGWPGRTFQSILNTWCRSKPEKGESASGKDQKMQPVTVLWNTLRRGR